MIRLPWPTTHNNSQEITMSRSRTFKALGALTLGLTCASAAQALPIITDWSYSISSIWSSFAPAGVTFSADTQTLAWGPEGQAQSSLSITDPAPGTVRTLIGGSPAPANIATGLTVTHVNNVVPLATDSLQAAQLTSQLTLWATLPVEGVGGPGNLAPVVFDIKFTETPNVAPCAAASAVPCNDIFVLTSGLLNATFDYLDTSYYVNIFPLVDGALSVLTPAECAAAGASAGCIGLTTVEGATSSVPFGITVSTRPLPEPGVLALLGIGLAGLAAARRRVASPKAV